MATDEADPKACRFWPSGHQRCNLECDCSVGGAAHEKSWPPDEQGIHQTLKQKQLPISTLTLVCGLSSPVCHPIGELPISHSTPSNPSVLSAPNKGKHIREPEGGFAFQWRGAGQHRPLNGLQCRRTIKRPPGSARPRDCPAPTQQANPITGI